jgi:GNAT superfamily N-acetyltransferase
VTTIDIRPMVVADVPAVRAVVQAADDETERRAGREPEPSTPEGEAFFRAGMERFVTRDPAGAWVAAAGEQVVGMATAVRRDGFWGLSMLFVHPGQQNGGVGRRLLDAAHGYADGAAVRMIMTSPDPRALRRYSAAGLAIHPAVEAEGEVDRARIPAGLPGRDGAVDDLDLVEEVDKHLGRSRAEDVAWALAHGARLEVVDTADGRGFAVHRRNRLTLLGATTETVAAQVLWRVLAASEGKAGVWCLTAQQDWAVRVALAARLRVVGAGPLFVAGMDRPPGPWVPSGWYF